MTKQIIILLLALTNSIIAFSQNPNYEVYALKFTSEGHAPSSAVLLKVPFNIGGICLY